MEDEGGASSKAKEIDIKKMDLESLKKFRTRFSIPLRDDELKAVPYYRPSPDSPEMVYMRQRREARGAPGRLGAADAGPS